MEQGPILIRRIEPGDARQLVAFYAGLAPDSRVARFMGACRGISGQQARAFVRAPERGADGFVAVERATGAVVGHLCLEPVRPGAEEIAVATANRLHGRGIARELVKAAAASARRRGVRTWIATMFGGNRAIHRLLQRAGIPWRRKPIDSATELLTMDVAASAA